MILEVVIVHRSAAFFKELCEGFLYFIISVCSYGRLVVTA